MTRIVKLNLFCLYDIVKKQRTPASASRYGVREAAMPEPSEGKYIRSDSCDQLVKCGVMAHSKCMDESLLTCSMQTGVTGVRLILQTVAEGTAEVKSILLHEVNILFECKICDNIFRGFPNLLTHKRVYCRESVLTKSGDELIPGGIADDETGDRDKSSSGLMKDLDTDIADWNSANAENRPATKVTLNLLKRLAKRWMNSDESVPSFGSGFQGVRRKPPSGVLGGNKNVAQDAKKDDSAYTLVLPEDPVNRLHSMELRLRRSANASKFVKTVSRDELSIITRLEGCKTCDLMTRTCLVERCKRSFPDIETLAYHMNYSHADTRPSGPLSCLLCGKQLGGFRALRAHIQLSHRRVAMHYNDEVMKRWPEKPKEYSGNYRHIKRPNPNVVFVKEVPPLSNDVPVFPESPKQSSALDDSQVLVEKKQKGDISISKPPTLQVTDPIKSQVAADGLASGGANMVVTSSTNPGAAVTERRIVTLHTGGKNEQSILLFNKSRNVLLQLKPSAMGSKDRQHGKQNYVALLPKKYIVSAEAKISTAQRSVSRVQMKPSLPEILPLSEPTEVTSASEFSLPVLTSSDIEKAMSALYVGFLNNNAYNDVSVPTVPDVAQTVEIKVRRGPGRPRRLRLQSDGSDDHLKNPSLNPKLLCNRKRSKFPGNKMARGMLNRGIRWNPRRKVMLQRTKAGSQVQLNMESDFYMDEKSLKLNFAPATKALPQLRIRRTLKSPYNSEEYVNTWPGSREERMEKTAFRDRTSFHGSGWKGDIAGTSDSRSMHHRLPSRKARAVSKGAGSDECDYKFPVMFTAIQEQQLEEVADLDAFLCRRCGSQFTTRSNTERHCYAHLSFVRFRCRLCNTAAFYLSDMKRHLVKQCTKISSRKIGAKQFKENILPCNENQP
ncbi:unnamed protein product, partial [Soboliphyme baturini]|uniref:C2H2-type domain-containing protein n=1 Tax=Soboliphyme baturini TaxID=241478 RepID=A0A183IEN4_9BILA